MIQTEISIYDLDDRHILPVAEGTPLGSIYLESRNDEEPLPQHRHLDGMITLVAPDGMTIEWIRPGDKIYYVDGQRVRRIIYAADVLAANKAEGEEVTNELLPDGAIIRFTSRDEHQNVARLNVPNKHDTHQSTAPEALPAETQISRRRCNIRSETARRVPSHRATTVNGAMMISSRRVA